MKYHTPQQAQEFIYQKIGVNCVFSQDPVYPQNWDCVCEYQGVQGVISFTVSSRGWSTALTNRLIPRIKNLVIPAKSKKPPKEPRKVSTLETMFHAIMANHYPEISYETEYNFAPPRRWRFDIAIPEQRIAIELEGAVWVGGRHSRGSGMNSDCDKYNMAALREWQVYRFTINHLRDHPSETVAFLRQVFYGER